MTLHRPWHHTNPAVTLHKPCRDTAQPLALHRPRRNATGALPRRGASPAAMPRGAVDAGAALPLAGVWSLFAFHHLWPVLVPSIPSRWGCFHVRYSSTLSATQIRGSLPICPLLALLGKQLPFLGQGGASRFFVLIWQGCLLGARLCSWESSRVPSPAACSKIKAVPASRWQCLPTPLRGRPARGGGFRPPAPDARRPAVLG